MVAEGGGGGGGGGGERGGWHFKFINKLMNSDNYYLNAQLMKFIKRCLSLRNNLLSNESDGTHT